MGTVKEICADTRYQKLRFPFNNDIDRMVEKTSALIKLLKSTEVDWYERINHAVCENVLLYRVVDFILV